MLFYRRCILAFLIYYLVPLTLSAQFAHTRQKDIADANGKPLMIRATNLGNWLVPEGYMWTFDDGPQSGREIEGLVTSLPGPDKAATFWHQYRESYILRADIRLLHEAGFNAVRVPLHYKYFESDDSEGFQLLDYVVQWCREENIYVILDLHAAPGGRTGTNIDDSTGSDI